MKSFFTRLLPVCRLFQVVAITVIGVVRCMYTFSRQGWSGELAAAHAGRWARTLVRRLNIHIVLYGAIPDRGVMIAANHRSYLDIVVILSHIDSAFLAKAELRKWPVFGFAAEKGNTVFVHRSDRYSRQSARRAILERLGRQISVVVFPEGTTYEGPGILPFKSGIFRTAAAGDIPVVPVAVCYDRKDAAWVGSDSFVPHFLKIFKNRHLKARLAVGPVIARSDPEILKTACRDFIEKALLTMERQGDLPAGIQDRRPKHVTPPPGKIPVNEHDRAFPPNRPLL